MTHPSGSLQNLRRLPAEIVYAIFTHLPKEALHPFRAVQAFSAIATRCYYARLVIHWNPVPLDDSFVYMSFADFEAFASDPELAAIPLGLGVIHLHAADMGSLAPASVARLQRFQSLNVSYVFNLSQEPVFADFVAFPAVTRLAVSCAEIKWALVAWPCRVEHLALRVSRDPHAEAYLLHLYPSSLRSLSLSGVKLARGLFEGLPSLLTSLTLEEVEEFPVQLFNQWAIPDTLKRLTVRSTFDALLSFKGMVVPPTLSHFSVSSYELRVLEDLALPPTLKSLTVSLHRLEVFDVDLPEGLETLCIKESSLTSRSLALIILPHSLKVLTVEDSQLTTFEFVSNLPAGLRELSLSGNPLRCDRPQYVRFPVTLRVLKLQRVNLQPFSLVYPEGLEVLDITDTGLGLHGPRYPSTLTQLIMGGTVCNPQMIC